MTNDSSKWLKFRWLPLKCASIIVVVDQITKQIILRNLDFNEANHQSEIIPVIDGFFNIVHARNTGAAWSILDKYTGSLAIISFVVAAFLIYKFNELAEGKGLQGFGLSLIIGGTIGNLIDRAYYRYVIDFLDFQLGSYRWPAFNVADSAICVGVGFYILCSLNILGRKKEAAGES